MSIIMDQSLVPQAIRADHEALPTVGPQPCYRANESALIGDDGRKRRARGDMLSWQCRAARHQHRGNSAEGSAVMSIGPSMGTRQKEFQEHCALKRADCSAMPFRIR